MQVKHEQKPLHTDFITFFYKSSWQFCIMVEMHTASGFIFSEYNFDMGKKPDWPTPCFLGEFQLLETKHNDMNSFTNKISTLKSKGYQVIFSKAVAAEKIAQFMLENHDKVFDVEWVWDALPAVVRFMRSYGIGDRELIIRDDELEIPNNSLPVQSFHKDLIPIAMCLIQIERQTILPGDCVNLIWLYAMNGFFELDVFQEQKTRMKKISAECVIENYNGRFFSWKSNESKAFIKTLSDVVESNPGQIDETVSQFTAVKNEGTAVELLEKYHLTRK